MPFLDSLDIANRALQHCGELAIVSVTEDSKANTECSNAYDKVRRAELQRNNWRFAIRKVVLRPIDTTTMVLVPAVWLSTATYQFGAIVADANGQYWISTAFDNVNFKPGDSGADAWDMYFGPLTISKYDSTIAYLTGELVYVAHGNPGQYTIYQSLQSNNSDVPNVATAYDATATYTNDNVVSYLSQQWRCLVPIAVGVTPAVGPAAFDPTATYSAAQTVTGSDTFIYSSVAGSNIGHDPVTDGGVHWTHTGLPNAWAVTPTIAASSIKWLPLSASMRSLQFSYPVGSGPSSQSESRNVYRLPAGFLKSAPQDPKAGSSSFLGAPSGLIYKDWNFENNYIVTRDVDPIIFRFIADVTEVSSFDDMFCEGLACRLAEAVCQPLTQSGAKLADIASEYKKFMGEARTVNAIEVGPDEPPEDDFITCRI